MKYKVIIWGAGERGKALINALDKTQSDIVLIDKYSKDSEVVLDDCSYKIIDIERLKTIDYDYIFITPKGYEREILEELNDYNVPAKKIITLEYNYERLGMVMKLFTDKGYTYIWGMMLKNSIEDLKSISNTHQLHNESAEILFLGDRSRRIDRKKHIGLIVLDISDNVPERVISKCSRHIIEKYIDKETIEIVNINFYEPDTRVLSECDALFFAGGGIIKLNSKAGDFPVLIDNITAVAQAYSIPVMFIGVGVEACDNIEKYIIMRRAINRDCVKLISVRENMPEIRKYIYNESIQLMDVGDPGLYADKVYNISYIPSAGKKVVGLGTVNFINWAQEGFPIEKDILLKLYKELIEEITHRGYEWKIFCNGVKSDYRFAEEIIRFGKYDDSRLMSRPTSDTKWIEIMNGFDAIIAPRLHTNIVAYSLGIPCLPMVWDTKVQFFAQKAGLGEYCFTPDTFDAKKMVSYLDKMTIHEDIKTDLMAKTDYAVKLFLDSYL